MNKNNVYEECVVCGKETNVLTTAQIDYRYGYVEGVGQCCVECYQGTSRQLITISGRTILDTPNDAELGAKVRKTYYESNKNK